MTAREMTLMNSPSKTPCKNGPQPTARSVFADRPAPIKNSVSVRPVVAACPNAGAEAATPGTKLRVTEASRKKPINQGTCTLGCVAVCRGVLRARKKAAAPRLRGMIQSAREFDGRGRLQSVQPVVRARADH